MHDSNQMKRVSERGGGGGSVPSGQIEFVCATSCMAWQPRPSIRGDDGNFLPAVDRDRLPSRPPSGPLASKSAYPSNHQPSDRPRPPPAGGGPIQSDSSRVTHSAKYRLLPPARSPVRPSAASACCPLPAVPPNSSPLAPK